MRVLFLAELNVGGGAKANINIAEATSVFAEVAFYGIGFDRKGETDIDYIQSRAKTPISIRYFVTVYRTICVFKPDIIHATGMLTGILALFSRFFVKDRYKIILTLHHTSDQFRFQIIAKRLIPVLNHIDVLHYLTHYQRKFYEKFGLRPKSYKVIPNISYFKRCSSTQVDNKRIEILRSTKSKILILYLGRIVEEKQVHILIDVINRLNLSGHAAAGIIVGSGDVDYMQKLKNQSIKKGIDSKILFIKYTDTPELYIKACDFCIFPTIHAEALPLYILEIYSQNKTLVASNHPSIAGIVKDRVNALIAEEQDPVYYTSKFIELIENSDFRAELEMRAKNTFDSEYNSKLVINSFRSLYDELQSSC